jgi:hypothetical protein
MSTLDADSGELVPDNATQPFPNPGESAMDHVAETTGEIISQYSKAARLIATATAFASAMQKLEDCAVSIPQLDDPAIATGVNLDVTGNLVGQSRVLSDGTILSDAMYRLLIALRITRNSSIGSSPAFLDYLTFVFQTYVSGSTPFRYYDVGGMAVGIEVGSGAAPSADQIALLDDGPSPRAMGVSVGREWYDPTEWFGFAEDTRTGAKGFGLESDPTVGGPMSMLF